MNWLQKIKNILGKFWTVVFSEHNFTLGVENLCAVLAAHQQMLHDKWVMGRVMADRTLFRDRVPFVIYLLKSEMVTDNTGTHMRSCVVHPADWGAPNGGWLNSSNTGDIDITAEVTDGGWAVQSRFNIPVPHHMADHVVDYTRTLFRGADYDWQDNSFLFYVNPEELHLPEEGILGDDGVLRIYWKIFGWADAELASKDAVDAIYGESLNAWANVVWDIHQNGATEYNSKELLAGATGAVVAKNDGVVDKTWPEQNISCMLIGDRVYHAPANISANVAAGDNVARGTILYGGMMFLSGEEIAKEVPAAAYIPGIPVRTDLGVFMAYNSDTKEGRAYTDSRFISGMRLIRERGEGIRSSTSGTLFTYEYDPSLVGAYKWVSPEGAIRYTPVRHPTLTISGTNYMYTNPELTSGARKINSHPSWIYFADDPDMRAYSYQATGGGANAWYRWRYLDPDTGSYTSVYTQTRWPSPAYVLPLNSEYKMSVPDDYADMCIAREGARQYETVPVPSPLNPMQFILGNLRKARSAVATITVSSAYTALSPALDCIRKNIDAGSILTVYLQAYGDTVNVGATFTAAAGNAAVATAATLTVQDIFAEAEVIL